MSPKTSRSAARRRWTAGGSVARLRAPRGESAPLPYRHLRPTTPAAGDLLLFLTHTLLARALLKRFLPVGVRPAGVSLRRETQVAESWEASLYFSSALGPCRLRIAHLPRRRWVLDELTPIRDRTRALDSPDRKNAHAQCRLAAPRRRVGLSHLIQMHTSHQTSTPRGQRCENSLVTRVLE